MSGSGAVRLCPVQSGRLRLVPENTRRSFAAGCAAPTSRGVQPQAVIDMSATAPKRLILDTRKDDAHVLAEEDVVNLPAAGEEAST